MFNRRKFWGSLAGIVFLLSVVPGVAVAQIPIETPVPEPNQTSQFRHIEQPLSLRVGVTLGGLALISLELWWFLLSKPKAQQAEANQGVQEITITVDGGYEPSRIVVSVGQTVRLNFFRKDPSSCLEEVRLADFHISQELPLNQVTSIEFIPKKPGIYAFTCGMNMFRGVVEVQAAKTSNNKNSQLKFPYKKQEYRHKATHSA